MSDTDREQSDKTVHAQNGAAVPETTNGGHVAHPEPPPPKVGLFKRIWTKLDLDPLSILMMMK